MLDCETGLGETYIKEQKRVQSVLSRIGYVVAQFPSKTSEADIILLLPSEEGPVIHGIAEIKCRSNAGSEKLTLGYLASSDGYLISHSKLKYGAMVSAQLGVPYFVIVSLMSDNIILMWQITNNRGIYVEDFKVMETYTQKTVNGGRIARKNAFLPLSSKHMKIIE